MTQPGIPMSGDPGRVAAGADELAAMATTLLQLAATLDAIANDDITIGESADAIRARTEGAAGKARAVEPRYRETSAALQTFAVELGDAQDALARAESAYDSASSATRTLVEQEWEYERRVSEHPAGSSEREEAERDLRLLRIRLEDERAAIGSSSTAIDAAWQAFRDANTKAYDAIRPALDSMNDGFLDHVGSLWGDVVSFLSVVGDWIVRILDTVLTSLLLVVLVVVALVVSVVVVLAFLPLFIVLWSSGVLDFDLTLELLVGISLAVVPLLAPIVKALILREAATPTPDVSVLREDYGGRLVDKGESSDYNFAFANNGDLDDEGGRDSTVIDIVQVYNDDGSPRLDANGNPMWRVTLPSTMDWQLGKDGAFGDAGAVNDLGSNLALIMSPEVQAAYERAVTQAMQQAGIGPDDPVMLVGWSQGGILAGAMASDSPFNVRAIAVAGAPIDAMPISSDVAVLAFQHDGDAVPRLDGVPAHQGRNWVTVETPPPTTSSEYPHNIGDYATTASDPASYAADYPAMTGVLDQQDEFFSEYEISTRYEFRERDTAIL